jgi:hypothetical protein
MICYREYFERFKKLPKLNLEEIAGFEKPTRKYLYAYYGYIPLLDNYTDLKLSKKMEADSLSCLYEIAIKANNLKLIKYLKSINIIYDYPLWSDRNLYYSAIYYGCLKIIKYFELKEKDSPGFKNKIINCYITAACSLKKSIRILKYIESKYHLYITNEIIYKARNKQLIAKYLKT